MSRAGHGQTNTGSRAPGISWCSPPDARAGAEHDSTAVAVVDADTLAAADGTELVDDDVADVDDEGDVGPASTCLTLRAAPPLLSAPVCGSTTTDSTLLSTYGVT